MTAPAELEPKMTVPAQRTFAIVHAHAFLQDLLDPKVTPRVPKDVRAHARWLLRHYPEPYTMGAAHNLCPALFGPLPEEIAVRSTELRADPEDRKR